MPSIKGQLIRLGIAGLFLWETIRTIILLPYSLNPLIKQIAFIGTRSMSVIIVAGLFAGMAIALQFYDTLLRFGSVSLLGSAVGLSLIREPWFGNNRVDGHSARRFHHLC